MVVCDYEAQALRQRPQPINDQMREATQLAVSESVRLSSELEQRNNEVCASAQPHIAAQER